MDLCVKSKQSAVCVLTPIDAESFTVLSIESYQPHVSAVVDPNGEGHAEGCTVITEEYGPVDLFPSSHCQDSDGDKLCKLTAKAAKRLVQMAKDADA